LKIGLLTIGQSPRPDIVADLPRTLSKLEKVEAGALDGLSAQQIESLKPKANETTYVSRLADGSQVLIAKERLGPLLRDKIQLLRQQDAKMPIVLLCTGHFKIGKGGLIIQPSKILRNAVDSLIDGADKLGVLVPEETQIEDARRSWSEVARYVRSLHFSPYKDSIIMLKACAKALAQTNLIVMDCMGYSALHRRIIQKVAKRPVIAARTITFRFLEELLI
jgi:protein AroM